MKKSTSLYLFISFALLLSGCSATAGSGETQQDPPSLKSFSEMITAERLEQHLTIFAGDSLLGRGTGQPGIEMAADYLASQYEAMNFPRIGEDDSYFQYFNLEASRVNRIEYRLFHQDHDSPEPELVWSEHASEGNPTDFSVLFGGTQPLTSGIAYIGYGIYDPENGIDHLEDADVTGNWVMVFAEQPEDVENLPDNFEQLMEERIANLLFRQGARGIIVISDFDDESYMTQATEASRLIGKPTGIRLPDRGGRMGFAGAVLSVSPDMASKLLDLDHEIELNVLQRRLAEDLTEFSGRNLEYFLELDPDAEDVILNEKNVMGYLEGCHEELKDEIIVISAHYDHMGIDSPDETGDMLYNGADDNGSGTITTLLLAETLHEARQQGACLDRSVLMLHVAAEEHGLLGSYYYSENPILPIEQTITNFNIDMIGRKDYNYQDSDEDYLYVIGAEIISSGLDSLMHVANEAGENLKLDMLYNDLDDRNQFYRRSDHWNFGRLGIPFIFFFSGVHDDYHQPSDTVDKIEFELMAKRARMIYHTLIEVANSPVRPKVDNQEFINRTRVGR